MKTRLAHHLMALLAVTGLLLPQVGCTALTGGRVSLAGVSTPKLELDDGVILRGQCQTCGPGACSCGSNHPLARVVHNHPFISAAAVAAAVAVPLALADDDDPLP